MAWNRLQAKGAAAVARALAEPSVALVKLDMSWNCIGNEGAGSIAEAIICNRVLATILLGYNRIGDAGGILMGYGLRRNETLAEVDLEGFFCALSLL